jgi:spore germination protein
MIFFMKNKLIIPILLLALVIITAWGYSQFQARRQWEINAENQYQRAFEEFTNHVGNMESAMSKTLVAGSFPQSNRLLTDIWRESNSSQTNLGQLPLSSMELSRIKMLLAKVSTFSFNSAQNQLIKGNRLNNKEWNTLKNFRDQTQIIQRHLTALREQFYTNRARWLEVDRLGPIGAAGIAGSGLNSNKVTKAFLMLEDGLRRVPDIQFEGNNLGFIPKPTGLAGTNISQREAITIARRFLGPDYRRAPIQYDRVIHGGFPSYMSTVTHPQHPNRTINLSISIKGGHVAWMLGNRAVRNARLRMTQAEQAAKAFLSRNRYPAMEAVSSEMFANIATVSLAPVRNEVIFYPELIKVQVAQDNGEILGIDAIAFLTFNDPKAPPLPTPRLRQKDIRRLLNPHLTPEKIRLVQVLDEMYNKVLCYEVSGILDDNRYLIYYNANTGKEEKLRRVDRNGNEIQ